MVWASAQRLAAREGDNQLVVESVSKRFGGVTAVQDVSLDVPRGSILSIIGPNGAGKTSLLNMISGFYKPDSGRIVWNAGTSPSRSRATCPPSASPAPSRTARVSADLLSSAI